MKKSKHSHFASRNPYAHVSDEFEESLLGTAFALKESTSPHPIQAEFDLNSFAPCNRFKTKNTLASHATVKSLCNPCALLSSSESIDEEERIEAHARLTQSAHSVRYLKEYLKAFLASYSPALKVGGSLGSVRQALIKKALMLSMDSRIQLLQKLEKYNLNTGLDNYELQFQRDERSSDVAGFVAEIEKIIDELS